MHEAIKQLEEEAVSGNISPQLGELNQSRLKILRFLQTKVSAPSEPSLPTLEQLHAINNRVTAENFEIMASSQTSEVVRMFL